MTAQRAASFDELFDPHFLARLSALTLRIGQAQKGGRLADQRTTARGQGADFADFKPYVPGDDLRAMDWNAYRRLGKLFVRVFEERQNLPVYLVIDASQSMFVEQPPRVRAAQRAALALATVALAQQDAVSLFSFGDAMNVDLRGLSGRGGTARMAQLLADVRPAGRTGLAAALDRLGAMRLRRGLIVILSDFFDDGGIEAVVAAMGRLPHRLLLVQLTKAYDADPSKHPALTGDVLVDDGEADQPLPLSVTPEVIDRYRAFYDDFTSALTGFAEARSAGLARIDADRDVIDQLLPLLARGGRPL